MSNVSITELLDYVEEHMMKAVDHLKNELAGIRTGKASPALVENIMVEYYGTSTRLKELAGITAPEPRLLVIQPWDPSSVSAIEKAILGSKIGISPVNDGKIIRLPIPELSEERRNSLVKQVRSLAEDSRVAIRNVRRDGNEIAKKAQKNSEITEDDLKGMLEKIQKLTDDYIKEVDDIVAKKEKELLSI
ncbi:MAG TPA: ribosome recycling factor [Victivallales bacterium]|nr:ribosome recycling factor [Victivallales bacterium]HRR06082.1 ribosome recycling factor [Victivallales bacterium]HRR27915.1 ribosome recycling factor [Victivallales bacterium]HRU01862.1 ribosome recycling factor [Victivallales bacterium]